MALKNAYIFGSETAAVLASDGGWVFSSTSSSVFAPISTDVRTYTSAPSNRYSMECKDGGSYFQIPTDFEPSNEGIISISYRHERNNNKQQRVLIRVESTVAGDTYLQIVVGGMIELYVYSELKGTTSVFDWRDWHWISLFFEMSDGNSWKGKVEIDDVVEISEQTHDPDGGGGGIPGAVDYIRIQAPGVSGDSSHICEIVTYDDYADTSPMRFVGRLEFDGDGTDNGTWSGTYANTDSPLDTAAFQENTSTSSGHYLELTTTGSTDITGHLGVAPTVIDAVVGHVYATGASATIDMRVSDDGFTSTDEGPDQALSGTTEYTSVVSTTTPSGGGAWVGADVITGRVQVA